MYETFIDLDELILRCRNKLSRKFIQEAVSCYRASAFRSCIVSTWNAVVFDFLHKLRELEILGDGQAKKLLGEFEKLRSSNKFKELWQFESSIPEVALTQFELISTIEKLDIERLFQDRSRCAHPSMTSLEEPFEATAELARYHLRSAVTHLLERPPVQGRAARERIFQDIKSEYFPVDSELAIQYFQESPLARARFTLIKDIVIGLTKDLLVEDNLENERLRQFSALNAVSNMYPKETREILNKQLSEIILNRVTDENWNKTIIYLGSISAWDNLSEPCILKAKSYIDKIELYENKENFFLSKKLSQDVIFILKKASHVDFLREVVIRKLQIPLNELLPLKETCKDNFFKDTIIIPILRDLSKQATLDELLLIRSEPLLKSDETIKSYLEKQIKESSLSDLTSTVSKYQDKWLTDLIESELEVKIPGADLKGLLSSKSIYQKVKEPKDALLNLFDNFIVNFFEEEIKNISLKEIVELSIKYDDNVLFSDLVESYLEEKILAANLEELFDTRSAYTKKIDKPKDNLIELFDEYIKRQVKTVPFNEFLCHINIKHFDEIPDELIQPTLKDNIPSIIDKFLGSSNYTSAANNAKLLVKIAGYLSPIQWKRILEGFCKNPQIYNSYLCYDQFEKLFNRSLELSISIRPDWTIVSLKLGRLNTLHSNNLKKLIDSYQLPPF